ncbi:hypothetical protein FRC19_011437 [Serendipita sp. 401]|nr:hypothetical protein FRC19_011437 [Serendipita sp. 401]KAG9047720.1 hypothetical protein FS842_000586 [Serendipita sp. 407]
MAEAKSAAIDYTSGQPRRHHNLYFEDGTLVMQVENAIFKVHRSLLVQYSTVIQDMLSVPSGQTSQDGTDEKPLVMSGDSVAGWGFLLGLQYNSPRNRPKVLKGEDLLTILPIAHKYCMEEIETWIIEQLKETSGYDGFVDLIVASRIVDSDELYQDGLRRLLLTKSFPTLEQAERMGAKTTYSVMKVAADAIYSCLYCRSYLQPTGQTRRSLRISPKL